MKQQVWNDLTIWKGLQEGDKDAFTVLVHTYADALYKYGMRFSQDEELVRDCIQDVFLVLWRRRLHLKQPACLKFYLTKAVRQKIFRELPKWTLSSSLDDFHEHFSAFTIELEEENHLPPVVRDKIKSYINHLSPRQKEILYLRFYEGMKQKKIAELMSLNQQSVYNLLRSALQALRKVMDYESIVVHLTVGGFAIIF